MIVCGESGEKNVISGHDTLFNMVGSNNSRWQQDLPTWSQQS